MSHAGVLPSRRSVISGLHSFGEGHGACRFRAGLVPCFPAATRSITSASCPHLELMRVRQQRRPTSGPVTRSDRGLIEALRQQFELLKSACSSYDVTCQSYGTTPLPVAWDHPASTSTGRRDDPGGRRRCQVRRRRGLAVGGSGGSPPMVGFSCWR